MSDSARFAQQADAELRRYSTLFEALYGDGHLESDHDDLLDYYEDTEQWMSGVYKAVFSDEGRDRSRDAFGQFLESSFAQVTGVAAHTGRQFLDRPDQAACCILNGVLVLAGRSVQEGAREVSGAVLDAEYVAWLTFFRDVLITIRDLNEGDIGLFGAALGVLSFDISASLRQEIEQALVAPLVGALVSIEWAVKRIGDTVARRLNQLSCTPVIRLWGSILNWLYAQNKGFIGRARGFCLGVLMATQKTLTGRSAEVGSQIDDSELASGVYERMHIDFLIDVINRLISARNQFSVCRLFLSPEGQPSALDPRGPIRDRRKEKEERERDVELDDSSPNRSSTNPEDQSAEPPERVGLSGDHDWFLADDQAPERGSVRTVVFDNHTPGDWVYLTPANLAFLLADEFGASPAVAYEAAVTGGCRNTLSPETQQLLSELGL